jgi:Bacterial regulatory proteins, gntR family
MGVEDKHFSFSGLIETIERGGVEARKRLIELAHFRPGTVLPYVRELAALLDSSRAPVQKASIEILAALSRVSPSAMAFLIPRLHNLLANEPQHAIAHHAIEILHNYARTSKEAAHKVIPILKSTITNLKPKTAARISNVIDELSK